MALKAVKNPLLQVAKRGMAQAAVCPSENQGVPEVKCTTLPNKLMVSSLDLNGPLTRLSLCYRVGPRHETGKNNGIVHVIRLMTGFGTTTCSGFSIWRNTQHNGVHMFTTGDREVTGFHVVGTRTQIPCILPHFGAAAASPGFKRWEIKDNLPRLKYEIKGLSPQTRVIDNLHAAAFRTGLGNSLFINEEYIGTHTSEMLECFFKEGFTANRAALCGYNIVHEDLVRFAKCLELPSNDLPEGNSTYYGGEMRCQVNSYFAHVAIGTQSAGTKDIKDVLTYSLLQHAYGAQPVIAWGGSPSPINRAVAAEAPDAGVSCFSACYSDNGLFGFIVSSSADSADKAVKAAFKVLKSGSVTDADFKRAKALVKAKILYSSENSENLMEDLGYQSLQGGIIVPATVVAEAVEKITLADVNQAAKKIASQKFSFSGYGDLSKVPFLDELK